MRRPLMVLLGALLVVGVAVAPVGTAAASRYKPGDHVAIAGEWTGTRTFHNYTWVEDIPIPACLPQYITVDGSVELTGDNPAGQPIHLGRFQLEWTVVILPGTPDPPAPSASIGRDLLHADDTTVGLTSEASDMSGRAQFKDLDGATSTMSLTQPVSSPDHPDTEPECMGQTIVEVPDASGAFAASLDF